MRKSAKSQSAHIDPLLLETQLCFAMHHAARSIARRYNDVLSQSGLTYPQYLVLLALFETNPQTVGSLGSKLHLESNTLTPLLKRMEKQELISRKRREDDERLVEIHLTSKGKRSRTVATKAREHIVSQLAMRENERQKLRKQLVNIANRLSQEN